MKMIQGLYIGRFPIDQDPESWNRAISYSAAFHLALALLLWLLPSQKLDRPELVLTEVRFLEKTVPVPVSSKPQVAPGSLQKASGKVTAQVPGSKDQATLKKQASSDQLEVPRPGSKSNDVATVPTGPIVALKNFGVVGRKRGTLKNLKGTVS